MSSRCQGRPRSGEASEDVGFDAVLELMVDLRRSRSLALMEGKSRSGAGEALIGARDATRAVAALRLEPP